MVWEKPTCISAGVCYDMLYLKQSGQSSRTVMSGNPQSSAIKQFSTLAWSVLNADWNRFLKALCSWKWTATEFSSSLPRKGEVRNISVIRFNAWIFKKLNWLKAVSISQGTEPELRDTLIVSVIDPACRWISSLSLWHRAPNHWTKGQYWFIVCPISKHDSSY